MMVGSVISVSIRSLMMGVDCGRFVKLMKVVRFRILNMMDGMVVRFEILILMMLVRWFLGVNFLRQIEVVILIGMVRISIISIMYSDLRMVMLILVVFGCWFEVLGLVRNDQFYFVVSRFLFFSVLVSCSCVIEVLLLCVVVFMVMWFL